MDAASPKKNDAKSPPATPSSTTEHTAIGLRRLARGTRMPPAAMSPADNLDDVGGIQFLTADPVVPQVIANLSRRHAKRGPLKWTVVAATCATVLGIGGVSFALLQTINNFSAATPAAASASTAAAATTSAAMAVDFEMPEMPVHQDTSNAAAIEVPHSDDKQDLPAPESAPEQDKPTKRSSERRAARSERERSKQERRDEKAPSKENKEPSADGESTDGATTAESSDVIADARTGEDADPVAAAKAEEGADATADAEGSADAEAVAAAGASEATPKSLEELIDDSADDMDVGDGDDKKAAPAKTKVTRQEVKSAMARARPGVLSCAADASAAGLAKIRFSIAPSGRVTKVKLVGRPSDGFSKCVAGKLRSLEFPPYDGPPSTFTYPILLKR